MNFSAMLGYLALLLVYYVYDGYGRLLRAWAFVRQGPSDDEEPIINRKSPTISVIVPAFNEERRIRTKLDNLLNQTYARDKVEIILVNDGSTDTTTEIGGEYKAFGVIVVDTPGRCGKSVAQNIAVARANGEILVLTDMAVLMSNDFLENIVVPFSDPSVGCVTGNLQFRNPNSSRLSVGQGWYWSYEMVIRKIESSLGMLAVAAGPAMALRRSLWKDLEPYYGDDCVLPLDVILQGRAVVQSQTAHAWDEYFTEFGQEFHARVRMTVRNWVGTFSRRELLNPFNYPRVAFGLWSHKILRWLSPFAILAFLIAAISSAIQGYTNIPLLIACAGTFLICVGWICNSMGCYLPIVSGLPAFVVANVGFAVGVIKGLLNQNIHIYTNRRANETNGRK